MNTRTIKFRAWDTVNKTWVHVQTADTSSVEEVAKNPFPTSSLVVFDGRGECEIMQYTGLTDSKGKEIYEGDILGFVESETAPAYLQQVKWNASGAMFVVEDQTGYVSDFNHWPMDEVIGNVHENPELLIP